MKKKFLVSYTLSGAIRATDIELDVSNGVNVDIICGALYEALSNTTDSCYGHNITILSWSEILAAEKSGVKSVNDNDCAEYRKELYYPYMDDTLRNKVIDLELNEGLLNRALEDRASLLVDGEVYASNYYEVTEFVKTLLEKKYDLMYAIKMDKYCTEELYKGLIDKYKIDENLLVNNNGI